MNFKLSEEFINSKKFKDYLNYMKEFNESENEIMKEIEQAIYNSFTEWCKPGFQTDWLTNSKTNHLFYKDINNLINDAEINDTIYLLWVDINNC